MWTSMWIKSTHTSHLCARAHIYIIYHFYILCALLYIYIHTHIFNMTTHYKYYKIYIIYSLLLYITNNNKHTRAYTHTHEYEIYIYITIRIHLILHFIVHKINSPGQCICPMKGEKSCFQNAKVVTIHYYSVVNTRILKERTLYSGNNLNTVYLEMIIWFVTQIFPNNSLNSLLLLFAYLTFILEKLFSCTIIFISWYSLCDIHLTFYRWIAFLFLF